MSSFTIPCDVKPVVNPQDYPQHVDSKLSLFLCQHRCPQHVYKQPDFNDIKGSELTGHVDSCLFHFSNEDF